MKLAVPKEIWPGEKRVAVTPETVKKLKSLGFDVAIEAGAGTDAAIPDDRFVDAGATIAKTMKTTVKDADVIFKVRPPVIEGNTNELTAYKKGAAVVALLEPFDRKDLIDAMAKAGVDGYSMELMPRISRAQSMDVLSSQSNLAGYRAVLDAAHEFGRIYPKKKNKNPEINNEMKEIIENIRQRTKEEEAKKKEDNKKKKKKRNRSRNP